MIFIYNPYFQISTFSTNNINIKAKFIIFYYLIINIFYTLPINTEIEDSKAVFNIYGNRKIVWVNKQFVIKYGKSIDIIDRENIFYV